MQQGNESAVCELCVARTRPGGHCTISRANQRFNNQAKCGWN
jgi:hypothetical protein